MIFDWTISLGNIIAVCGFAGSGIIFVMMMRSDIRLLAQRVAAIENAMKDIAHSQMMLAEQKGEIETIRDRLNMISRRLDEHIARTTSA